MLDGGAQAQVAEQVDAADLKSASRKGVGVRVPSWAPPLRLTAEHYFTRLAAPGPKTCS